MTTFAQDLLEMMAAWNLIEAKAKAEFPDASPERIYQICHGAMNHALGL